MFFILHTVPVAFSANPKLITKSEASHGKSYQQDQQIVLRISFSNSTFLSKGTKKDMLFVMDIMQVTFVTEPVVDLPTIGFNSMLSNKNEQCSEAHAYLVPAPGT